MKMPITTDPITARGMSRLGLLLSPASWSACSKPSSAKMMPLVDTAERMPFAPYGLNPSAAVKLLVWNDTTASTKIVSNGTPTFHHVMALFVLASFLTLRKLTAVIRAIRPTATASPSLVRTDVPPWVLIQPCAKS